MLEVKCMGDFYISEVAEEDGRRFVFFEGAVIGWLKPYTMDVVDSNGDTIKIYHHKLTFIQQWANFAKIEIELRDK